ncbi:replication-relaxation family protein [Bacillus sp. BRMEA1]|nr:replication-relaxation family protein [Neobacillus endophyticus]
MRFATREQLQIKHQLGTDRNALKILGSMKEYLQVKTHQGRNIYYLNAKGRELVGSTIEAKWSLQIEHHLMRNDMYLYYYCPKDWRIEEPIQFKYKEGFTYVDITLIPDATFTLTGNYYFLEVDRTQSMADNKKKIELYSKLNPVMKEQFNQIPTLVFYTISTLRRDKLKDLCTEYKVNCRVYTKEDIQ